MRKPNFEALPPDTPTAVRELLKSCLEKDRRQRIADVSTVLFVVDKVASLAPVSAVSVGPGTGRATTTAMAAGSSQDCSFLSARSHRHRVWLATRAPNVSAPCITPDDFCPSGRPALSLTERIFGVAITPDGSRVVYVGNSFKQLFVRALNALDPVPIASGDGLYNPFISPDGQWVGFVEGFVAIKKRATEAVRQRPLPA